MDGRLYPETVMARIGDLERSVLDLESAAGELRGQLQAARERIRQLEKRDGIVGVLDRLAVPLF